MTTVAKLSTAQSQRTWTWLWYYRGEYLPFCSSRCGLS